MQFLAVVVPVAVTVVLAAVLGTLTGHIYRRAGTDLALGFPWTAAATTSGVGLLGVSVAGALAFGLTRTRLVIGDLRHE